MTAASIYRALVAAAAREQKPPPSPPAANRAPTVSKANTDQKAIEGHAFDYDAAQNGTTFNDSASARSAFR